MEQFGNHVLVDRIELRLQALSITDRKASMTAIGKPDLIRDIRRGRKPSAERLAALAAALETTTDYLQGISEKPSREDPDASRVRTAVPLAMDMDKDIPVYGTAVGAPAEYASDYDGRVIVEQIDLNMGEVIDYFRRPPRLHNRRDLYALYVSGDSMDPAFESGKGILIDPKRPPSIRDYVVIYLRNGADDSIAGVLLKRLIRRSASFIELEQFNPHFRFRLDASVCRDMHRVMPWDEAFGI